MKKLITSIILTALCSIAYAQNNDSLPKTNSLPQMNNGSTMHQPPTGQNQAVHAAIEACTNSSTKDSAGHPDRAAMHTCMTGKGFTPPENREGREPKGPPQNKSSN